MTTEQTAAERFAALIAPKRQPKNRIDDIAFIAALWRFARALEYRTIEDVSNLTQVLALAQRFNEIVNVAVSVNADRYSLNPMRAASMLECSRVLGIGKSSISQRRGIGERIYAERLNAASIVRLSESSRERAAIIAAADHANVLLVDFQARRKAA